MKYQFEQALIAREYVRLTPSSELWVKGKGIVALENDSWQADYSDEITGYSGEYNQQQLKKFEAILKDFDECANENN